MSPYHGKMLSNAYKGPLHPLPFPPSQKAFFFIASLKKTDRRTSTQRTKKKKLNMDVVTQNTMFASHASCVSCWSPASSGGYQQPNSSSPAGLYFVEGQKGHPGSPHHAAHRRFLVRPDIIDRLDDVSAFQYHHEGPYDAACAERNNCSQSSPVAALRDSNAEILKATPQYKVDDCLHRHRPLDGVAFYSPGVTDPEGNTYRYSEGSNMMTELDTNFMRDPEMVRFYRPIFGRLDLANHEM